MHNNSYDLDDKQLAAVYAPRGPVVILAGAGTGKTTTITHRISHLISEHDVKPTAILAVTFTTKAAGQLQERLAKFNNNSRVNAQTFHSAAYRQYNYFSRLADPHTRMSVLSRKYSLISTIMKEDFAAVPLQAKEVIGEIEWAKSSLISPQEYPRAKKEAQRLSIPHELAGEIEAIYAAYEEAKRQRNLLDFDDLLIEAHRLFRDNERFREIFRHQYTTFFIDEFQDVNPLQHQLLLQWLGRRDDITVVGDANQTIYSFTGASSDYLLNFTRAFEHAQIYRLSYDYRSTTSIAQLANRIIAHSSYRPAGSRLEIEGQRPERIKPQLHTFSHEQNEVDFIVKECKTLHAAGMSYSKMAILYRVNSQSLFFEQGLTVADIPFTVWEGSEFLARREMKKPLRFLREACAANPTIMGSQLRSAVDQAFALAGLKAVNSQTDSRDYGNFTHDSLRECKEFIHTLCALKPQVNLSILLDMLSKKSRENNDPGVSLSTIHAAKGLEWDAVFLPQLIDGIMPFRHAIETKDKRKIDEELRLLYVGVTRARTHVYLSWAQSRFAGGNSRTRSRFLDNLGLE